eukprot:TRINITY_DN4423_c0_g1_i6.p1 TRINITY_DN4423_c0_g1~~TRINITY_DN4423_c0_g1_i6.p1  ORF type:complete len:546 (-),score=121.55 TRINITY_DN4423_c0_g1_i6:201-1838(-)
MPMPSVFGSFLFVITVCQGAEIGGLSLNPEEAEVLLPVCSEFEVTKVEHDAHSTPSLVVHLRQLAVPPLFDPTTGTSTSTGDVTGRKEVGGSAESSSDGNKGTPEEVRARYLDQDAEGIIQGGAGQSAADDSSGAGVAECDLVAFAQRVDSGHVEVVVECPSAPGSVPPLVFQQKQFRYKGELLSHCTTNLEVQRVPKEEDPQVVIPVVPLVGTGIASAPPTPNLQTPVEERVAERYLQVSYPPAIPESSWNQPPPVNGAGYGGYGAGYPGAVNLSQQDVVTDPYSGYPALDPYAVQYGGYPAKEAAPLPPPMPASYGSGCNGAKPVDNWFDTSGTASNNDGSLPTYSYGRGGVGGDDEEDSFDKPRTKLRVGLLAPENEERARIAVLTYLYGHSCRSVYLYYCKQYETKPKPQVRLQLPDEPNRFNMTELILNETTLIGNKGLLPVLEVVRLNPNLRALSVAGNGIKNTGVEWLVHMALEHPGLSSLDLSDNRITNAAGTVLNYLAQRNPRIVDINMRNTRIDDQLKTHIELRLKANRDAAMPL